MKGVEGRLLQVKSEPHGAAREAAHVCTVPLPTAFMLLLVACGGGGSQAADTPTPEAEVMANAIVQPTPTCESLTPSGSRQHPRPQSFDNSYEVRNMRWAKLKV